MSGIDVRIADLKAGIEDLDDVFGVLVQYPATDGAIRDYAALTEKVHAAGGLVVAATDLLAPARS